MSQSAPSDIRFEHGTDIDSDSSPSKRFYSGRIQDLPNTELQPEDQQQTLKRIDQRQDLLLEDLERLNKQIINIIEVYATNRQGERDSNPGPYPVDTDRDVAA